MQYHKTVVVVVVLLYDRGYVHPVAGIHRGGVERLFKLIVVYVEIKTFQLGHVVHQMLEVERFETPGGGILNHADGAPGVDNQQMRTPLGLYVCCWAHLENVLFGSFTMV